MLFLELMITWSLQELADIRDILSANGIEYFVKTRNLVRSGGMRGNMGTFALRTDAMHQYSVYVKNVDYEKARHLMGR